MANMNYIMSKQRKSIIDVHMMQVYMEFVFFVCFTPVIIKFGFLFVLYIWKLSVAIETDGVVFVGWLIECQIREY